MSLLQKIHIGFLALYVIALGTTISGMEIFSVLLTLTTAALVYIHFKDLAPPPLWIPLAVFAAIGSLSVLLGQAEHQDKLYDLSRMRFFILYPLLFYALQFTPRKGWLYPLIGVSVFIGIYGFCQHFTPLDLFRPEGKKIVLYAIPAEKLGPLVLGTFNHHLTFSNVYLPYACLWICLGLGGKLSCLRNLYLYLALGSLIALLCLWTQSRAAWAAVPISVGLIALYRSKKLALLSGLGFVILLFGLYFIDEGFQKRFDRTFIERHSEYNLGRRTKLWIAQWHMFLDYPVLGVGYNHNERLAKPYLEKLFPDDTERFFGHAHSTPLQILSSTGALGSLAYLIFWFFLFRFGWQKLAHSQKGSSEQFITLGLLVGLVSFHIQGLTQWNFGDAEVLHNLMFLTAVLTQPREKTIGIVGKRV